MKVHPATPCPTCGNPPTFQYDPDEYPNPNPGKAPQSRAYLNGFWPERLYIVDSIAVAAISRNEAMAKVREALRVEPQRKRLGTVSGVSADGAHVFVKCEDWEPSLSDMFFIEGVHLLNPNTMQDSGFDLGLSVVSAEEADYGVTALEVQPRIMQSGMYRNAASLPIDGAIIYQPAGATLRAVHEWALDHNT